MGKTNKQEGEFIMPFQPIDDHRFVPNKVVEFLLDNGGYDMNDIALMDFTRQDRMQFAQLIGHSLSGFSELNYVDDETYDAAVRIDGEGGTDAEARNRVLRNQINQARDGLRAAVCALFKNHPDDLEI